VPILFSNSGLEFSLIPGLSVKLSMIIPARLTVLSAVGARPPHDGLRRRWWINVAIAVSLLKSSQKIGRPHNRHQKTAAPPPNSGKNHYLKRLNHASRSTPWKYFTGDQLS
jgi:hypothetical protein